MVVEVAAFNSLKGTYQSLITSPLSLQLRSGEIQEPIAGSLTLTLANGATFSGMLQLGTQRHTFSGRLSGALKYERKLKVKGFPEATLKLAFLSETKTFSAEITGLGQVLTAVRGLRITTRQHALNGESFSGNYRANLQLRRQESDGSPEELVVKVSRKGRAVYRGSLPDGRLLTGSTRVFGDGQIPLYQAFKSTRTKTGGYVGGTLLLDPSGATGRLSGALQENLGTFRVIEIASLTVE
jgi:hypothetical protein